MDRASDADELVLQYESFSALSALQTVLEVCRTPTGYVVTVTSGSIYDGVPDDFLAILKKITSGDGLGDNVGSVAPALKPEPARDRLPSVRRRMPVAGSVVERMLVRLAALDPLPDLKGLLGRVIDGGGRKVSFHRDGEWVTIDLGNWDSRVFSSRRREFEPWRAASAALDDVWTELTVGLPDTESWPD